jgi:Sec-independent protein translocase protein TatA
LKELRESIKELREGHKEFSEGMKELRESQKKTDMQIQETDKQIQETSRQMKETDKRVGDLTGRFGETIEHLVLPNLVSKFHKLGFSFTKFSQPKIADEEHGIFLQVDAFLEDGDKALAVEVKTKINIDDIDDHIKRMEKLRKYADLRNDKRTYLAAVAAVIFSDSEKDYALKKGLYVLEPSGDSFNIIEPKGKYYPHKW